MKTFDWQSYFDFLSERMRNSEIDKFARAFQASNQMAEIMSSFEQRNYFSGFQQNLNSIQEAVQRLNDISHIFSDSVSSAMHLSLEFSNMSYDVKNIWFEKISEMASLQPAYHDLSEMILSAASVIERASQYIPELEAQEAEETKDEIQKLSTTPDKKISWTDLIVILTFLLNIYTAIIQSLPNEQLDRIIAQNDVIISQQAELIELNQEDQGLYEVLTDLKDSINSLANEVNALREEVEDLNDLPDSPDTSEIEDPQEQDADAEEQDGDL